MDQMIDDIDRRTLIKILKDSRTREVARDYYGIQAVENLVRELELQSNQPTAELE